MRIPRHLLIAATVAIFAISQLIAAFAATFQILTRSRLICAAAHGVFWSTIAPVAARLVPPDRAGRATALVFLGNSLAIVLGVPLGTALGQWLGRRAVLAVLAFGGAAYTYLAPLVRRDGGLEGLALLGERFISSGHLAWLPALAAVFTVAATLGVLAARRTFPVQAPEPQSAAVRPARSRTPRSPTGPGPGPGAWSATGRRAS